jgi:hypothetical protein
VAHPRIPGALTRLTRDEAREVFKAARTTTLSFSKNTGVHPLENVEHVNPRPGLRRWVAPNTATGDRSIWKEAWASVHHDGSVSLAAAVGGHRMSVDGYFEGWQVEGRGIESAVADFMALVHANAQALHQDEYDVRVGVEWAGEQPLSILTIDGSGFTYDGVSTPLRAFTSIRSTLRASASAADFHRQVYELAEDCVNQGGLAHLHVINPLPEVED